MFCLSNKEEFQCKSNECVKWSFVCDGVSHCSNHADEECDMCTNDLYQCKDSSRINCTLACSTLGYIPCKNYMDRKICASVNKKSINYPSSNYFRNNFNNDLNSSSFFSEKFLVIGVCLFMFTSIIVLLFVLYFVFQKKFKHRKENQANDDQPSSNLQNRLSLSINSSSSSSILNQYASYTNLNHSGGEPLSNKKNNRKKHSTYKEENIILNKTCQLMSPQFDCADDFIFNASENFEKDFKQKRLYSFNENSTKNSDELNSSEMLDQLYGEPPPTYVQAKFYPKATAEKLIGKIQLDDEKSSHIYENIDELGSANGRIVRKHLTNHYSSVAVNNTNIPGKRSKFQGLKKYESASPYSTNSNSNSSASKKLRNINKQLSVCPLLTENTYKPVSNNSKNNSSSSPTNLNSLSMSSSGSSSSQRIENKIAKINSNINNNTDTLYYQPKFKTNKTKSEQFL